MRSRTLLLGAITSVLLLAIGPLPAGATAPYSVPCNGSLNAGTDNSFVSREASSTHDQGWISMAAAWISPYTFDLCSGTAVGSASHAWVAIQNSSGGGDIVQIGLIRCQHACLNPGFEDGALDVFIAAGQGDLIQHQPWPVFVEHADGLAHTYELQLTQWGSPPAAWWFFYVDGNFVSQHDDSWRTWFRDTVAISTEVWNCGDQEGGRDVNHEKFRSTV
jgi:hypothetical protein